jgi:hypothetical protein
MKSILFFLLLCYFAGSLSAQVTTSARAGASFSSLHFKGDNPNQGRITGYGGIAVKIDLPNQLYFQPELLYSIRGYRFPPTNFNTGGRVSFGYITVPLLAGYKVSKNFSIMAGPELGYLVRARSHFDGTSIDVLQNYRRKFNVDADAGVAYNITRELSLEARFSFGVTALFRGVQTDVNGNEIGTVKDGFHRVLQVGLALAL